MCNKKYVKLAQTAILGMRLIAIHLEEEIVLDGLVMVAGMRLLAMHLVEELVKLQAAETVLLLMGQIVMVLAQDPAFNGTIQHQKDFALEEGSQYVVVDGIPLTVRLGMELTA